MSARVIGDDRFLYDIGAIIHRAKNGEPEQAEMLLAYFCNQVEADQPVNRAVMQYLAKAFQETLQQKKRDPRKPLGLVRSGPGNPGGRPIKRRMTPDAHEELRQAVRKRILDRQTDSQIKKDLAPAFGHEAKGISADTVRAVIRSEKDKVAALEMVITQLALGWETDQQTVRETIVALLSKK